MKPRPRLSARLLLPLLGLIAGCSSPANVMDPRGPDAALIANLSRVLFISGTVIFLAVMGLALFALWQAHRRGEDNELDPVVGRRLVVWGGIGLPILVLFGFLLVSVDTDRRSLASQYGDSEDVLTIEVTGRQFWWDVRYRAESPHLEFRTANEIHIPLGQPVRLELRSADVLHSFWVPNLQGKMDLIPGRLNTLFIQADEPGVMLGYCAEFCGDAHAHMQMIVVAQDPAEFEAWRASQLRRRERPEDPVLAEGYDVFMANACSFCHAIRGTLAGGRVGPDLTHFGGRRTIAAAILPNTPGHLMGWLADPQAQKPGNHMPSVPIEGQELQLLADYLLSLR